jgi:hypothetical protein
MRITPLIKAAAVVLLAGCQTITHACTLAACSDALNVEFSRTPTGPFRVEAFADGSPNGQVFDCAGPSQCREAYFTGMKASRVTIKVTVDGTTTTQEFTPRYETVYPNGRDCPGRCQQATVTVTI